MVSALWRDFRRMRTWCLFFADHCDTRGSSDRLKGTDLLPHILTNHVNPTWEERSGLLVSWYYPTFRYLSLPPLLALRFLTLLAIVPPVPQPYLFCKACLSEFECECRVWVVQFPWQRIIRLKQLNSSGIRQADETASQGLTKEGRRKDKDYMTRHFLVASAADADDKKKSKNTRKIPVTTMMMTISENESRNFDD